MCYLIRGEGLHVILERWGPFIFISDMCTLESNRANLNLVTKLDQFELKISLIVLRLHKPMFSIDYNFFATNLDEEYLHYLLLGCNFATFIDLNML